MEFFEFIFSSTHFTHFLWIMAIVALVVFIALHYIEAGYGMMYTKKWGLSINNKTGWILMESPVFFAMMALWWYSGRRYEVTPVIFLIIFQIHYFQRSFIFPFLLKGRSRMPITIILSGIFFNLLNALMQGGWIFYASPCSIYQINWLTSPQFIIGTIVFFTGMYINLRSDYIIRHLRMPGDTKHYIPHGGMYRYVSSANYLGELIEWIGFAILTWSLAGAVFAWWTFANLAPRSKKINQHYAKEFGTDFTRLNLKSLIPFIY